jgi:Dyp-type peroxidase family
MPQITTAARWTVKPSSFLNVGITAAGLDALGQSTAGFPPAFVRGATSPQTASLVGDVGDSAPANWVDGFADGTSVHIVLSLWVHREAGVLEQVSATLRDAFAGALTELAAQDATALPDNKVHFGYTDNISQPTVEGAPPSKRPVPDQQPVAPTGEFLLGYPNQNASTYKLTPKSLSDNASFGVFRLLEQDVAGFEAWLDSASAGVGVDREVLAAKVCGRWRTGVPLVLSPQTATPDPPLKPEQINDYTYVPDDVYGYSCPVGSHMRRTNPRNEAVIGGPDEGSLHRIIRRAMPYGPPYDPAQPSDEPRGLVGWFINADIANQFEFVMNSWVNTATFVDSPATSASAAPGQRPPNPVNNISGEDVLLGINDPATSSFTLSIAPGGESPYQNKKITGFGPFVTTRGGAYCYLPSISALKVISTGRPGAR